MNTEICYVVGQVKVMRHVKVVHGRKQAVVYVLCAEGGADLIGNVKLKSCSALHIADLTNAFLVRPGGAALDEKASVHALGVQDGERLEIVMRSELVNDGSCFCCVVGI